LTRREGSQQDLVCAVKTEDPEQYNCTDGQQWFLQPQVSSLSYRKNRNAHDCGEKVDRIESSRIRIYISDSDGHSLFDRVERIPDHGKALGILLEWIEKQDSTPNIDGIRHRVVLGDRRCLEPQLITKPLLSTFEELAELAPDHLPQVIDSVEAVKSI
jgi:acetate kinase